MAFTNYNEAVQWIEGIMPVGDKPGLLRIQRLLEYVGHPEKGLKCIHVAGSNGKGSTCAFISSVLIQSNYNVGMFTSPHIEKFTNRITLNNIDIAEADVLRLINTIKPFVDEIATTEIGHPSMFDIATCMAFMYYAEQNVDFVVLEAGLGGRIDSTNVVTPLISVITTISFDHMNILGDTIEKIAFEKAGIIKTGVPVICSAADERAIQVIREKCNETGSELFLIDHQYSSKMINTTMNKQKFDFSSELQKYDNIVISMNGSHQVKNASTAIMCIEVLKSRELIDVHEESLRQGLRDTFWPGRLELIQQQPRILLDGAHNPEGAKALSEALNDIYSFDRLHIVLGVLDTKDYKSFIDQLLPIADSIIITEPSFRKRLDSQVICNYIHDSTNKKDELSVYRESSWVGALHLAAKISQPNDLIVVTGSLYLISDIRQHLSQRVSSLS